MVEDTLEVKWNIKIKRDGKTRIHMEILKLLFKYLYLLKRDQYK